MDFLQSELVDPVSNLLNTHILIYLLIGGGLYFTVRTRFIQIRYFGRMLRQLRRSHRHDGGISSFQAFCVGLASRVGTGNIAGVAIALTVGGPGAIFWMWVVAAVGMATAVIEATLAQIFKVRSDDGAFRGGPAYYIQRGLHSRAGGVVFAMLLVVTFATAFNMVETNAVSGVLKSSHGIDVRWTTIVLAALAAPVLFGGVRRIARFAGSVLPLVALVYTVLSIVFGALAKLTLVWALADLTMAVMAIANLITICLLGKWAFAALRDYHRQSAGGRVPVFVASEAGLPGVLDGDIWEPPQRRQVGALPESLTMRRPELRSSSVPAA